MARIGNGFTSFVDVTDGIQGGGGTSSRLDIAYFVNADGSLGTGETNTFPSGTLAGGNYMQAVRGTRNFQGTNVVTFVDNEPTPSIIIGDYEITQITGDTGDTGGVGLSNRIDIAYSDNDNGVGNLQTPTGRIVDSDYVAATSVATNNYIGTNVVTWTTAEPEVSTTVGDYEWTEFVGDDGDNFISHTAYKNAADAGNLPTTSSIGSDGLLEDTDLDEGWTATQSSPTSPNVTFATHRTFKQTNGTGNYVGQGSWDVAAQLSGTDGSTGDAGDRGAGRFERTFIDATPPPVFTGTNGDSEFNDDALRTVCEANGGTYTEATNACDIALGGPKVGDTVVLTYFPGGTETAPTGDPETRAAIHDGTSTADSDWEAFAVQIDGSLLVLGTVDAESLRIGNSTLTSDGDGALVVGTLVADNIDANAITAEKINLDGELAVTAASGAIGWGKTGPNDFTNTGMFIGNEGGFPFMNFGSSAKFFYYDGQNDILFFTGQTETGIAVVGGETDYTSGAGIRHDLPASVTEVALALVGGGGGGDSGNHDSGNGGTTTIQHFNASDVQVGSTYTAAGGDGGSDTSHFGGVARLQSNGNPFSGNPSAGNGDNFSGAGFTATGGTFVPGGQNVPPSPGNTGGTPGAGGGAGITADFNTAKIIYEGGDAASSATAPTLATSSGDYFIITVGAAGFGGSGSSASGGTQEDFPRSTKGGKGGNGIVTITINALT